MAAREEPQASGGNSRNQIFSTLSEIRPLSPALPREQPMFPLKNGKEGGFPLATQEVLHDTRRHLFHTTNGEVHHVHRLISTESRFLCFVLGRILLLPSYLKRRLISPIETLEEPHGLCCKLKGQRVLPQLEIRPDSPTPTQMEPQVGLHNPNGGLPLLLYL